MAPPTEPENWLRGSGTSTGLIEVRVVGVTQVEIEGAQKFFVEKDFACMSPGRLMNRASPCRVLVPDLVTMLRAGPAVQPNSEEKALERTVISWTAPMGMVAIIVWRPQASSLLAPSSVVVVVRRDPAPVTK